MSCRHYVFSTHTCLVTTLGLFTGTDWQWRRGTWKLPHDRPVFAKSKMPEVSQDRLWKRFLYLSTLLHRYSHRPLLIEIQGVRNSLSRTWTWTGHHHHQCLSCCYFSSSHLDWNVGALLLWHVEALLNLGNGHSLTRSLSCLYW